MNEAPLQRTEHGLVPDGDGWFVLNTREARWFEGPLGAYCNFEGEERFPELGINVTVLLPGLPNGMYHREPSQEDFLVLSGECLLLIEGEERRLRAWDFVHCPPEVDHIFIGAGDAPCVMLAVGSRAVRRAFYPVSELAQRHGAGVERETGDPREAYAGFAEDEPAAYRDGWLPDF